MNSLSKQPTLVIVATFLALVFNFFAHNYAHAGDTPEPSVVTLVGSLQNELGCSGDWEADCTVTRLSFDAEDNVWHGGFNMPAGNWEYKVALNDSWDENYGANANPNGANIVLSLAYPTEVWFYYSHETHWITDNVNSIIAIVVGSFQSEIGCSGDWNTGCLRSWLQDLDGDGLYSFSTSEISPGSTHEFKWVIHLNGEDGDVMWSSIGNHILTMPNYVTEVIFTFDPMLLPDSECGDELDFEIAPPPVPVYGCDEFAPPMADFPVSFKRNHAIPLRAELFDGEDEITDADIVAPPFMEVTKLSSATGDSTIVTGELLPTGQSDDGNEFYYTDSGYWQLIFDTKIEFYTSPGTYEIKIKTGDPREYQIVPTCVTEFVVE